MGFLRKLDIHQRLIRIEHLLSEMRPILNLLRKQGDVVMADLTNLTNQVTHTTEVEESAILLLTSLGQQIASLKTDPVALQALADELQAKSNDLAAAITANTPAA